MPTVERGGWTDVTHDRFEVRHRVLVGVRDPVGPHDRVVRHPHDSAGHAGRAADQLLLLEDQRARSSVGRGQRGDHAATTGSDDHEVDGGVPRRHVTPLRPPEILLAARKLAGIR